MQATIVISCGGVFVSDKGREVAGIVVLIRGINGICPCVTRNGQWFLRTNFSIDNRQRQGARKAEAAHSVQRTPSVHVIRRIKIVNNFCKSVFRKFSARISRNRRNAHKKPVVGDAIKIQRRLQLNVKTRGVLNGLTLSKSIGVIGTGQCTECISIK